MCKTQCAETSGRAGPATGAGPGRAEPRTGADQLATGDSQRPDVPRLKGGGQDSGSLPASRGTPRSGPAFAWTYRPCDELGGDGLNVIPLGGRRIGLYVLDVSGDGVASALLSVTLRRVSPPLSDRSSILVRDGNVSDGPEITPPAEVVDRLNELFPFDAATGQSTTMIDGVLDAATGTCAIRFRWTPRPGGSSCRRGAGDPRKPRVRHRLGGGRLRGAIDPARRQETGSASIRTAFLR